jgi:hypothetical protein
VAYERRRSDCSQEGVRHVPAGAPDRLDLEGGDRGNLLAFRLGRRDYTTQRDMREMVRKLQEAARTPRHRVNESKLTEEQQKIAAQEALRQSIAALRQGLKKK